MDFVKVPSFLFRFLLLRLLSADCLVRVLSRRRASKRQKTAFYFRSDRDYVCFEWNNDEKNSGKVCPYLDRSRSTSRGNDD